VREGSLLVAFSSNSDGIASSAEFAAKEKYMRKFHRGESILNKLTHDSFSCWHGVSRIAVTAICLSLAFAIRLSAATGKEQINILKDAQAITVIQTALTAMGGAGGETGLQDAVVSGTLTATFGENSVSMPIVLKSKGTQMVRVELQNSRNGRERASAL
jgi:hypothetical protein